MIRFGRNYRINGYVPYTVDGKINLSLALARPKSIIIEHDPVLF